MKMALKIASFFALIVAVGGGFGYLLCLALAPSDVSVGVEVSCAESGAKAKVVSSVKKSGKRVEVKITQSQVVKPMENVVVGIQPSENDDVEEDELNPQQRAIFDEIQAALDNESLRGVRQALAKFSMKTSEGGLGGAVPKCMRLKAVEALGWFGKAAAVDLIGCMADVDREIAFEATSQFEQALQDPDLSATDRSQYLTDVLKALSDVDTIDSLLFSLNEMPNSLKADTVAKILTTGSAAAQKVMTEQLDFYLDDEVKALDDIKRWKIENPDED